VFYTKGQQPRVDVFADTAPVGSLVWAIGTLVGAAILVRGITRIALSARLRHATERLEDRDIRPPRAA